MSPDQPPEGFDSPRPQTVTFGQALLPIGVLFGLIVYGLILRPQVYGQAAFPLEIIFVLAAAFAVGEWTVLGHSWRAIQASIVQKLIRAIPAFLIFFAIGLVIGSWMVSGTIPMLIYYGLQLIHPSALYILAFAIAAVFSTLTGTSWGSAGTVGVVLIGIAEALGGHLGITAGAVIGGAYFGDKLSPLSDTTNIAALAADVNVYSHIRSMLLTTVPSALIAGSAYAVLGLVYAPAAAVSDVGSMQVFLNALDSVFAFHLVLLLPPLIVLVGSVMRKPTVPVLMISALTASVLALLVQPFTLGDVMQALYKGFHTGMAPWAVSLPDGVVALLDRGGLYALIDAIVVAIMVFVFIGAMDHVGAIDRVVQRLFQGMRSPRGTVLGTLGAAAVTNSLTSNQYATSFIVADAFKARYDALGLSRTVLSRSLEDTGTMIETVVPWTPSAVFMAATLGVGYAEYAPWQLLSLANLVIAPLFAVLGLGLWGAAPNPDAKPAEP